MLWITFCVFPGVSGNEEIWRTCPSCRCKNNGLRFVFFQVYRVTRRSGVPVQLAGVQIMDYVCVFPGVSGNEEIWRTCIT